MMVIFDKIVKIIYLSAYKGCLFIGITFFVVYHDSFLSWIHGFVVNSK